MSFTSVAKPLWLKRKLRACTNRECVPNVKRTRMLDHMGSCCSFPNEKEPLRARHPTIHHRTHLGAV
jgi:hypothetical protein